MYSVQTEYCHKITWKFHSISNIRKEKSMILITQIKFDNDTHEIFVI